MKKPRKATAKHKRQHLHSSGNRPKGGHGSARANLPPQGRNGPAVARVAVYSADERQAVALLLLPFLLMTVAIGLSQSMKRWIVPLPEVAILSPVTTGPAVPGAITGLYRKWTRVDVAARTPAGSAARPIDMATRPITGTEPTLAPVDTRLPTTAALDTVAPRATTLVATAPAMATAGSVAAARDAEAIATREPVAAGPAEAIAAAKVASLDLGARAPDMAAGMSHAATGLAAATALEQPFASHGAPATNICTVAAARFAQPVRLGAGVGADKAGFGRALAAAARTQIDDLVVYTDNYRRLDYPLGDVSSLFGVCTDVVIRAYRAVGVDLQTLVHEARAGSGDTSIQHRRVETLRKFFAMRGAALPVTEFAEDYRAGDIVTYHRPQNRHSRSHIAVVADEIGPSGNPMIIHNRGWGPQMEDGLFVDEITGHYRFDGGTTQTAGPPQTVPQSAARVGAAAPVQAVSARPATRPEPPRETTRRGLTRGAGAGPAAAPGCETVGGAVRRAACSARHARMTNAGGQQTTR